MLRIDGDILVFKAGFAAERTRYRINFHGKFEEFESKKALDAFVEENQIEDYEIERWRELDRPEQALWNTRDLIKTICEGTKQSKFEVILSGEGNFRYEIFPEYKANRNKSHRPYYEQDIKQFLIEKYNAIVTSGEEADDQLGIRQFTDWYNGYDDSIIATLDKDLGMIPGLHYNWEKGKMEDVDPVSAMYWFYKQVLMGDPIDGIAGIPGVGKKHADNILSQAQTGEPEELYTICRTAYANAGLGVDVMHKYARVLWIRRYENEIWNPPA